MNRVASKISPLVTTKWLSGKLPLKGNGAAALRVVDGANFDELDAKEEFNKRHIPGAQFFDVTECRDHNSPYPKMIPSPRDFEEYVGNLGINNNTHVVVYDHALLDKDANFSAPRVWWMLRYFGHDSVSVLNGGLARWIKDGYEVTDEVEKVSPEIFKAQPRKTLMKAFDEMKKIAEDGCKSLPLADARGAEKFKNRIKGAMQVHHSKLHLPEGVEKPEFKSPEEIKEFFKKSGIDVTKPFVAACNSGVTACTLAFGAFLCGNKDVPVYDGSWQEWAKRAGDKLTVKEPEK